MALGHEIETPWRRVLHRSWSEGYRTGTTFHLILECGHEETRPASKGATVKRVRCLLCWTIAACDKHGHVSHTTPDGCGRCGKARKKMGTADEQIARYANDRMGS